MAYCRLRTISKPLARLSRAPPLTRHYSDANASSPEPPRTQTESTTHFGYQTINESAKQSRVGAVFTSVASSYDNMNDLMSLGVHRLWKDHFVRTLAPGSSDPAEGWHILDVAGGTGDIAFRMLEYATRVHHDTRTKVTIADINPNMLLEGQKRSQDTPFHGTDRLDFLEANAEKLSTIENNSIDLYTVAFGIRNFTNKQRALEEAFRVLRPGGIFACLEFSKVDSMLFNAVYKRWSFGAIPMIGQIVAGDRDSYQYLVESIERFPSQTEFAGMIEKAGFTLPRRRYENLSGGIAAIHRAMKPLETA